MNKSQNHLKIGLDYHGVINDNPQYFKLFCAELLKRGHEVYILSGGPRDKIIQELKNKEICYTSLFTLVDYYKQQGKVIENKEGEWYVDEQIWNQSKAEYCRQNQISIQIDDSKIYGQYFTTPYCLYNNRKKQCTMTSNKKIIDLKNLPVTETIKKLEELLN